MEVFDSCDLVAPFKIKGAKFFRRTLQRSEIRDNNTDWDAPIPDDLVPMRVHFFIEVTTFSEICFPRCLKIDNCANQVLITFCDGSDSAFGDIVPIRWEGEHEVVVRLVEAKGKLFPLNLKGDTVRSEMCGAVFTARFQFTKVYHFLYSMAVLGAINKEAYGFSTFYANRVVGYHLVITQLITQLITKLTPPSELCSNYFGRMALDGCTWQKMNGQCRRKLANPVKVR